MFHIDYDRRSGLPPDSFSLGMRLLIGHPRIYDKARSYMTAKNRFQEDFLPHLKTARTYTMQQGTGIHSLPGIGTDFWKYSRAHIYRGSLPPSFPESFWQYESEQQTERAASTAREVRHLLNTSSGKYGTCKWDEAQILKTNDHKLIIRVPINDDFDHYQEHTKVTTTPEVKFHGTRLYNLESILHTGLLSSEKSHGITGLWLTSSMEYALQWNTSSMELLPGLALQIAHPPELLRQNRKIRGNRSKGSDADARYCLELQPDQASSKLSRVQVVSFIFAIPTIERHKYHYQLRNMFHQTVVYMKQLPIQSQEVRTLDEHQITAELWDFVSFRLAFRTADNAMSQEFGGPFKKVRTAFIQISITIVHLMHTLALTSVNNRISCFPNIKMCKIPAPMREFFTCKWPELQIWTDWSNIDDNSQTEWNLTVISRVSPWIPTAYIS